MGHTAYRTQLIIVGFLVMMTALGGCKSEVVTTSLATFTVAPSSQPITHDLTITTSVSHSPISPLPLPTRMPTHPASSFDSPIVPPPTNVPPPTPTKIRCTPTPTQVAPAPGPTATPFPAVPTANTVNANAVVLTVQDWTRPGLYSLWVANLDGTGELKLLDHVDYVQWAPNGRWLACAHVDEPAIQILAPDGTDRREIWVTDKGNAKVEQVAWSPDGSKIAFVQHTEDIWYLGVAETDSGGVTYLVQDPEIIFDPKWSPDGRWLVYTLDFSRVQVANLADRSVTFLEPYITSSVEDVVWAPQSDRLAIWRFGNGRYAHGSVWISTLEGQDTRLDVGGHSANPVWRLGGEGLYVVATNFAPDDPCLDPDSRLLHYDREGVFIERIGSIGYIGVHSVRTLSASPNGQWLANLTVKYAHQDGSVQFVDLADGTVTTHDIDLPGELLRGTYLGVYRWTADSQHVVVASGQYRTPDSVGVREYGSLYVLDLVTGASTRLTNDHWMQQYTISPVE